MSGFNKKNWPKVKFGDIVQNVTVRVDPTQAETDVYVGLEHLDPESIHLRKWGHPSEVSGQKLVFKKGDVIFGRRRAYQRKLAVAEFDGICSAHAMVLRAKPKMILPEFLPFFLQSDMFMNRAIEISVGSLSPTINWKTMAVQEFPLPPLAEQKRLAEILWAADEAIERWVASAKKIDSTCRIIVENFVKNIKNLQPLREIAVKIGSGKTPKGGEKVYSTEGILFLRSQNIYNDGLRLNDSVFISTQIDKDMASTRVYCGDVLLNITGASIGRCLVYNLSHSANVNQHVCIIRPKQDLLNPNYLHLYLTSKFGREQIDIYSTKGNREGLNFQQLGNIRIPLPNIQTQANIVNTINLLLTNLKNIHSHEIKIKELIKTSINKIP